MKFSWQQLRSRLFGVRAHASKSGQSSVGEVASSRRATTGRLPGYRIVTMRHKLYLLQTHPSIRSLVRTLTRQKSSSNGPERLTSPLELQLVISPIEQSNGKSRVAWSLSMRSAMPSHSLPGMVWHSKDQSFTAHTRPALTVLDLLSTRESSESSSKSPTD